MKLDQRSGMKVISYTNCELTIIFSWNWVSYNASKKHISRTWWLDVSETLTSSEPERTAYQLVPMSPWRYTEKHSIVKENQRFFKKKHPSIFSWTVWWQLYSMTASEPVFWPTGDAFLQALVESTQANPLQQTGVESLKGLHIFQTRQDYVNIFPRALRWSGEI